MKLNKEQMVKMARKLAKMDFCPEQKAFYKKVLELVEADAAKEEMSNFELDK